QEDRTELSDVASVSAALEQPRVEAAFQCPDRLAHPGLRKMDVSGCRADTFQPRDGFECAQLSQRRNCAGDHGTILRWAPTAPGISAPLYSKNLRHHARFR